MKHLFCFGFGYTAATLAGLLDREAWTVSGTSRSESGVAAIAARGFEAFRFDRLTAIPASVTHILSSVPPDETGDPVIRNFGDELRRAFDWIGYLSTTGVYGDRAGGWVDEQCELLANTDRGRRRVRAEREWVFFKAHIFRLPGIYGPGRNQLEAVKDGTARRIVKPGQVFSRAHVEDIGRILFASMNGPNPGRIYNVADDEACPPQEVVTFACGLLGVIPPPEIPFEDAKLSPMARSFYADSKRVSNQRVKDELGVKLLYPNYREGLSSIFRSSPHLRAPQAQGSPHR